MEGEKEKEALENIDNRQRKRLRVERCSPVRAYHLPGLCHLWPLLCKKFLSCHSWVEAADNAQWRETKYALRLLLQIGRICWGNTLSVTWSVWSETKKCSSSHELLLKTEQPSICTEIFSKYEVLSFRISSMYTPIRTFLFTLARLWLCASVFIIINLKKSLLYLRSIF